MICSSRERLRIWSVIAGSRSSIGLRHRRRDVILGHLLRNHQQQRLGAVTLRCVTRENRCRGESQRKRDQDEPAPLSD